MVKKIFTLIILWASLFMPIFGVSIHLPGTATYNSDKSDLNIQQWKTQIDYNDSDQAEQWLYNTVSFFNSYLWWSFAVICTWAVIFGWFRLITSQGDKKALKQWLWALIWSAVGIVIAMLSYTIVTLLANLNP